MGRADEPARQVDGALYRFSRFSLLAGGIGCTAIGIADRADAGASVDVWLNRLRSRRRRA